MTRREFTTPADGRNESELALWTRFRIYQKERFPVISHGILIAAFTFSAASYSRICRGVGGFVPWHWLAAGIFTSFLLFLLLRFFDEFKDADDDARYRPYRAVPRGLVSLREIGWGIVFAIAAAVTVNLLVMPMMLPALALALLYILIMWREFFIPKWLRRHPVAYLVSHMMVMPMIDFYTTGLDWMNAAAAMPGGLLLFLAVTFCNGCVIEIGRKIRMPDEEETGVETYSALWGPRCAAGIWLGLLGVTGVLAFFCCHTGGYGGSALPFLIFVWLACAVPAVHFLRTGRAAAKIETAAGIWTIAMYLLIGGIPMLLEHLEGFGL